MIPLLRRGKTVHPRSSASRNGLKLSATSKFRRSIYSVFRGNDHFGPDEESGDHGKPGEIGDRPDSDTEQETNYQSSSDEEELDRQSFALLDLPSGESFITATSLQYGNTAKKADEPEPPSQIDTRRIKSAKSKQSIIQITISDDQSCDSEFSQRRLKALLTKPSLVGDYDYDITKPNSRYWSYRCCNAWYQSYRSIYTSQRCQVWEYPIK